LGLYLFKAIYIGVRFIHITEMLLKVALNTITPEISIFSKSTSTSLFTCGTFYQNLNNCHEYLIQHSLK